MKLQYASTALKAPTRDQVFIFRRRWLAKMQNLDNLALTPGAKFQNVLFWAASKTAYFENFQIPIPSRILLILSFLQLFQQLTVNKFVIKFCR